MSDNDELRARLNGWRIMPFTGSFKRHKERWEIYDPAGSGGAVCEDDVKDWSVRNLLDALAALAPASGGEGHIHGVNCAWGEECHVTESATPTPQAAGVSEEVSLFDRVEFALRDAGFDYDTAFELAQKAAVSDLIDELHALAAAGSAPEGWVLVPREPTPEMLAQMAECYDPTWGYPDRSVSAEWAARSYAAMLAATPTPPAAPQESTP